MTFVMWRLHRNQLIIAGGALVALTAALFLISKSDKHVIEAIVYITIVVPLLLGLFWGAPLLAKEFEDGTNGLAWTQGVTRRRWLWSSLGWAILAAAAWGAAVTAVVTWWSLSEVSLGRSRLGPGPFDIQGIVPVAYAVFAVVLGIAVGSAIRRVIPAMATTLAAFVAVRVVIAVLVRPHYMSPLSRLVPIAQGTNALPAGAWLLSNPSHVGTNRILLIYQPADRFWTFQGIETGVFLMLAAGVLALAYRMVVSRDA
jgi:ABC-type transport system involved in multi-copper enzyme maturation permease subunit